MKLIYHKQNISASTSLFDTALLRVSNGANPLYLASPYIGLGFLNRLIDNANDWKLLSDVEAWLSAGNRKHRALCWQFIIENLDRIKHVSDLHAKVAIGNNLLFLGSANFTDKGVLERDELSILIDDRDTVQESLDWFNMLWNSASSPAIDEGDELLQALDEFRWTAPKAKIRLSSSAVKVRSILTRSTRPNGFDVALSFAKSSIEESVKLLPLEDAFRSISDQWFSIGQTFTFKELFEAVLVHQPSFAKDELWSLIIRETVNHWLGGLILDGFDRYVYEDGIFNKWMHSKLHLVDELDGLLSFVINKIDLYPANSLLPFENYWLRQGVAEHHILLIVDLLINSGLLIEIDNPGEIEMYSLDSEFMWPKRWQKLTKARAAYELKKTKASSLTKSKIQEQDEIEDEFEEPSAFFESLEASKAIANHKAKNPDRTVIENEVIETARRNGLSKHELIDVREKNLLAAFEIIESNLTDLNQRVVDESNRNVINKYMPKRLKQAFNNFEYGPYIRSQLKYPDKLTLKSSYKIHLSRKWLAGQDLFFYPKALQKWRDLINLSTITLTD